MKIYCPVWGDRHINLLNDCLGRSLRWPRNNMAVEDAEWIVTTKDDAQAKRISKIIAQITPLAKITVFLKPELSTPGKDAGHILIETLLETIKICLRDGQPLLMATPDFIYGDGTIDAFKITGDMPGTCVSIPNIRVLPEVLNHLNHVAPTNEKLVSIGFENPHAAWINSKRDIDPGMTFIGGISWFNLSKKVIGMRHWLPSPFFVNFTPDDLAFFSPTKDNPKPHFLLWDHVWPSPLITQGRLRYIGSSEAAVMIEVTDPKDNIPNWNPPGKSNRDEYNRTLPHNVIQKQFIYTMRSE